MQQRYLVLAVAIAAAGLGALLGQSRRPEAVIPPPSIQNAGSALFGLNLATPDGKPASLRQWTGKVMVVNFWATWCPPCREEMPSFSRIQQKHGDKNLQFVGIGIDTPDAILDFQKKYPVSYPLLMGSYEALQVTGKLGNASGGLPFTAILDRQGRLVRTKVGKLEEAELEAILQPLMAAAPPAQGGS